MIRRFALVFWVLLLSQLVISQAEYAAVMTITYPNVEIRRANTELWLPLVRESVAPLGIGDSLRTDERGRAYVTFSDVYEVLVLPNSTLTVTDFSRNTAGQLQVELDLDGHIVQRNLTSSAEVTYQLTLDDLIMTTPAEWFSAWTGFEGTSVVIVNEGSTTFSSETVLAAGQGIHLDGSAEVISEVDFPYNAARLIGQQYGCKGMVETGEAESLNVRVGPGLGYTIIGYIANSGDSIVMGVNEARTWYRIQHFTGFGWVQALAVKGDCPDLPVYPNLYLEMNPEAFELQPFELELLRPFYGDPVDNLWFYRSVLTASP